MNACDILVRPLVGGGDVHALWPRPDLRIAHIEALIGIFACFYPPADLRAWRAGWERPPSPEQLAAALAPYRFAFELEGDGPRFMQDMADLPGDSDTPETLLIEAPGESTRRNNTALLVKPGRVRVLSRKAAAMVLLALQTYAPAGGRGNLTSVRGGGPMTTLAMPPPTGEARLDLWRLVWANVPYGKPVAPDRLDRVLPWLAPTRTADTFPATIPGEDADERQAFWGMPRRIRLDFAPNKARLPCDLTGEIDDVVVTGWRQRPNGVKYVGFVHPLSPYYDDPKAGKLPLHPQPGGIGYRQWLGLAIQNDDKRQRAACVEGWFARARQLPSAALRGTRLLAAGYDMDNMKARGFVESEMPLPAPDDEGAARKLAEMIVPATEIAARALRGAIREALGEDGALVAAASESLWEQTQADFFDRLVLLPEREPEDAVAGWDGLLRKVAPRLFDEAVPLDPSAASFDFRPIVNARRQLLATLSGYGKAGDELFGKLGLEKPDGGKPKLKAKRGRAA